MILFPPTNTDMWRLIFPILGAILFAAHLYFWGSYFWLAVPVILLILLIIPFRPVCWLWQLSLIGFGIEWFISAYNLYLRRITSGMPFALGVSILIACGVLTILSSLVFYTGRIKEHYPLHV